MERDVSARVQKLAPFLSFDADPYPVITNGRLVWVLDGYTTSDRYPYSQSTSGSGGLSGNVNYVRNSVKATVDAYDGTVKFYVIDPKDPIIRAYQKAFPDLFTRSTGSPPTLPAPPVPRGPLQAAVQRVLEVPRHRHPALLPGQRAVAALARPEGGSRSARSRPRRRRRPTAAGRRRSPRPRPARTRTTSTSGSPATTESFLILQPFVPVSQNNQQTRLASFMTAKSDPANYGKLQAFVMPQGQVVQGPVQVAANINKDPDISRTITLLGQQGSSITYGNVQLIPVGTLDRLRRADLRDGHGRSGVPAVRVRRRVHARPGPGHRGDGQGRAERHLRHATATTPITPTNPTTPTTPTTGTATVAQLLQQAVQKFADANAALKNGDLATYAADVKAAQDLVTQAQQQMAPVARGIPDRRDCWPGVRGLLLST